MEELLDFFFFFALPPLTPSVEITVWRSFLKKLELESWAHLPTWQPMPSDPLEGILMEACCLGCR